MKFYEIDTKTYMIMKKLSCAEINSVCNVKNKQKLCKYSIGLDDEIVNTIIRHKHTDIETLSNVLELPKKLILLIIKKEVGKDEGKIQM